MIQSQGIQNSEQSTTPTTKILALVRDLLLRSRIEAVAATLGLELMPASTLDLARTRATELAPAIIVADLSDVNFSANETAHTLRAAAPHARLVGFASHVDLKSLASGHAAGFDLTLSRSPPASSNYSNPEVPGRRSEYLNSRVEAAAGRMLMSARPMSIGVRSWCRYPRCPH